MVANKKVAKPIRYHTFGFINCMDSNNGIFGNQLMFKYATKKQNKPPPINPSIDLFVKGNLSEIVFKNYNSINRHIKLPKKENNGLNRK